MITFKIFNFSIFSDCSNYRTFGRYTIYSQLRQTSIANRSRIFTKFSKVSVVALHDN